MAGTNLNDPQLLVERAFIGGAWCSAGDGKILSVENPATGEVIGTIPDCGPAETSDAIEEAERALAAWRVRPAGERAALLERWHALVLQNARDLALIMTLEQGKPVKESGGEIQYAASFIKWFAEEGRRINGYSVPAPTSDRRILVMKEPVGVTAAITPWNFPAAMITRKCAPALAAGCTVVIKPSEMTPFSALALALLAQRAGIPPGVLNVVTGLPAAIGAALTSNPSVRKLSFTGSSQVGALLMRQSAETIKRLSLELGGNAPMIVFDDADIDVAVASAMACKFRNAGQTCVCANRILVQDAVYEAFAARLAAAVRELKVGDGRSSATSIGPLINERAVRKVREHIEDALQKGAIALTNPSSGLEPARFVDPVILTGGTQTMRLAQEETFGPVAPLFRFYDEAEAIELANATPHGLASYFYTQDIHRAWRVAERLEAGIVALNTGVVSMEMAPFGGIKQSGLGREGGAAGIEEYLELKAFHIGGLKAASDERRPPTSRGR